jgi:hypothetical protein
MDQQDTYNNSYRFHADRRNSDERRHKVNPAAWDVLQEESETQPGAFRRIACTLFLRDPEFEGCYVSDNYQPGPRVPAIERNMPNDLWLEYCAKFIATKPEEAKKWLAEQAERCKSYASAEYVSSHAIAPPELNFDRLHMGVIETFRKGYWRTSALKDELPPSDRFSAFAFLTLLPSVRGDRPFFPANGILFKEGMRVLSATLWFLHIGISVSNDVNASYTTGLGEHTPLIAVLQNFINHLHHREGDPFSFSTLWDSNPPHSQWSCLFSVLSDLNRLLHIFNQLINPINGKIPVMRAYEVDRRTGTIMSQELTALLSPYYDKKMRPVDKFSYNERPNILGAIAQWDEEVQRNYADKSRLNPRDLPPVPSFVIDPRGVKPAPPPATQAPYQSGPGRYRQPPPAARDNTPPHASNPNEGKKPAKKARVCLLRYKDSVSSSQKAHGPGNLLEKLDIKPRYPATDVDGNTADGASHICFLFTMDGLHGCTNRRCNYAHLDGADLPEHAVVKFASLTKTINTTSLGKCIEYTPTGFNATR